MEEKYKMCLEEIMLKIKDQKENIKIYHNSSVLEHDQLCFISGQEDMIERIEGSLMSYGFNSTDDLEESSFDSSYESSY